MGYSRVVGHGPGPAGKGVPGRARGAPVRVQAVRFAARDGREIAGDLFRPRGTPRAVAVVAPAMGVRRSFYATFGAFLAEAGLLALSVDYRGIGDSAPARLRGFPARLRDWGELDLSGACDELRRQAPDVPLLWVGHSVGAQLMGLVDAPVSAAVFVAAGTGHPSLWPATARLGMGAAWWVAIPLLTAVAGRLPMKALGQGEDIPAGVAREWAEWGRHPRYVRRYADSRGGAGYARYAGPIRAYSFSDDGYAPPRAAESLLGLYSAARVEHRRLRPEDLGVERIGHFAPMRQAFARPLWSEIRDWLVSR
jgi:predicted alpha/beta hydrolase